MENITNNLLNRYKPTTINELIGLKHQISNIVNWLNDFNKFKHIYKRTSKKTKNKNFFCSMLLTGDNGTGKTTLVNSILNDMKYTIKTINFRDFDFNTSNINDNIISTSDIYNKIDNVDDKNNVIVIDELEFLGTTKEKNIIISLLKTNFTRLRYPIIFIGNNTHKKIITLVKKESYHINLQHPTINNMMCLLERICLGENIVFEHDMRIINKIIEHSQKDYRRLIIILGELCSLYRNDIINYDMINKYFIYIGNKDIDMTIYQNTAKLFTEFNNISSVVKIFENDKTNIPLMVQQNYFAILDNNDIDISTITSTTECIALGDIIDNYIHSEQNWSLQEIYGYYSCVYPSYMINYNLDTIYRKNIPKNVLVYPKDYNKTSTKCINYKNIKNANTFFVNNTIYDYIYMCKYIKYMILNNNIKKCKMILKYYNISISGIMYILKIDKINGTKIDITKDLEKRLKYISNEPPKQLTIKKTI
jgi:Flp pilus assembly CpaF family ATPase